MAARYGNLEKLKAMMMAAGCVRIVAKRLATNDNSKQQIYLGSDFKVLNIIPFGEIYEDSSEKNQILKASLAFRWLHPDGSSTPAPNAQLILYPQYPEVRMSGFLLGSKNAPSELMAAREAGRILFLGIDPSGQITAVVVAPEDDLAREFNVFVEGKQDRIFHEIALNAPAADTKAQLTSHLRRIASLEWINSKRLLSDGSIGPCEAPHCGGYTLEAELGIKPNGFSEPDFMGWAVKQHNVNNLERPVSGSPITLMTPEPTGGYYKEKGVEAFLRKYGYADKKGREDRINFGGIYRVGEEAALTKLTLVLDGYDAQKNKLIDATKGITLLDRDKNPAAIWNYTGLIEHWKRKHERAVYVPSIMREEPQRQYRYSNSILFAEGTDFLHFLKSMSLGNVYYDPAVKLEGASTPKPKTKRRSQFRVRLSEIPSLYSRAEKTIL